MRFTYIRASLVTLAALAVIGSATALTPVSAQTAVATAAPTQASAKSAVTVSVPAAAAATAAATSAVTTYPLCDPNATPVATVASAAATTVATAAATAAGTPAPTATVNPQAGYLGIGAKQVLTCGAVILDINPGFAADKGGLKTGDVVVAVGSTPLTSLDQFRLIVQGHKAGDTITLVVQRAGSQLSIPVTLDAIPNTVSATQAATAAAGNPTAAG